MISLQVLPAFIAYIVSDCNCIEEFEYTMTTKTKLTPQDDIQIFVTVTDGVQYQHERGNHNCAWCWLDGHPLICKNCGGLVHSDFLDEHYNGYVLAYTCEGCGKDYEIDD